MTPCRSQEYAKRYTAKWTTVYPSTTVSRREPVQFGRIAVDFRPQLVDRFPDLGLLELPRATIIGPEGWVVGDQCQVLADHSWFGPHLRIPKSASHDIPKRKLRGVCLSLASDWAYKNYAHFLLDCIPRFHLFVQAGYTMDDVDWVYVPAPLGRNAEYILDMLQIPSAKLLWARNLEILEVDTLLLPSFPGIRRNYPSWVPKFLRSLVPVQTEYVRRRIYLSRSSCGRNVTNESAVHSVLSANGFEEYDTAASPARFSSAECVVGLSGAAFANIGLCSHPCMVLEIIPTDHVHAYYYTLADSVGVEYNYFVADSSCIRAGGAWGPSPYSVLLDSTQLAAILEQCLRRSTVGGH